MWARVKGKTENDLLEMDFKAAYMFRPGYIQPMRGIRSRTQMYQMVYSVFRPIYAILRHFPASATNTSNVGKALIEASVNGSFERILNNRRINKLAAKYDEAHP